MAVLSGFTSGKSRKSVGEVTFTRLKGQNVAKAKIMRNPNQKINEFQLPTITCLTTFAKFYKYMKPLFELTYEPTKRGSVYNAVMKNWMPSMPSSLFYPGNAMGQSSLEDAQNLVPGNIYGALSMDIPDDLTSYGGVNSTGVLSITGASAAATVKFSYPDGSLLQPSDSLYVYFICAPSQDFFTYNVLLKRIIYDDDISSEAGSMTSSPPISLPYKCMLAVAAIKRNSKIIITSPIIAVRLDS